MSSTTPSRRSRRPLPRPALRRRPSRRICLRRLRRPPRHEQLRRPPLLRRSPCHLKRWRQPDLQRHRLQCHRRVSPDAVTTDTAVTYAYQPRRMIRLLRLRSLLQPDRRPGYGPGRGHPLRQTGHYHGQAFRRQPGLQGHDLPYRLSETGLGNHQHHDYWPHQRLSDEYHRSFHAVRPAGRTAIGAICPSFS